MAKQNAAALAAESVDFDLITPGWYHATIESFTAEDIGDGERGRALKLAFEIDDAAAAGRKVWLHLCIWHKTSEPARKIAIRQIGEYLHAAGVLEFDDDEKPLLDAINAVKRAQVMIKVATEKDKTGQYGDRSTIRGFKRGDDPRKPSTGPSSSSMRKPH
jgi:Protein of unknown function (DUF669)